MDIASVLTDILVVLVAAKVAAEVAERLGVPAVVGEIVAGILVGPSVLGLVSGGDEVVRTLGEIGVILLLLEVGMEMDLAELGRVGRASLLVAGVGVVVPMVLGIGAMHLVGAGGDTALFVGAALTATSVGITARVFGDLRALASVEARTVLGAAVADDVMGLVCGSAGRCSVPSTGWRAHPAPWSRWRSRSRWRSPVWPTRRGWRRSSVRSWPASPSAGAARRPRSAVSWHR
jgi:Kef-type K+ transport system membrane component KefB